MNFQVKTSQVRGVFFVYVLNDKDIGKRRSRPLRAALWVLSYRARLHAGFKLLSCNCVLMFLIDSH